MSRNVRVKRLLALAAGTAGAVALVVAPGSAQADPVHTSAVVTKNITFSCTYPLIGARDVPATVTATFPDSVAVGTPIDTTDFSVAVSLDEQTLLGLTLVGSATVEGTTTAGVELNVNGTELGVTLPGLIIPSTDVTGAAPVVLNISGLVPSLTVKAPGRVDIGIGSTFSGKITPKRADGTLTGLGTFDLNCSMLPGQDTSLVSIPVT